MGTLAKCCARRVFKSSHRCHRFEEICLLTGRTGQVDLGRYLVEENLGSISSWEEFNTLIKVALR